MVSGTAGGERHLILSVFGSVGTCHARIMLVNGSCWGVL